jgi:hypothetical protein
MSSRGVLRHPSAGSSPAVSVVTDLDIAEIAQMGP